MKVPAGQTRWRTIRFYRLACVNVDISMELAVKVHKKKKQEYGKRITFVWCNLAEERTLLLKHFKTKLE